MTTAAPAQPRPAARPSTAPGSLSMLGIVRSEWIKFLSVRSTAWLLGITIALMVGTAALFAATFRAATAMESSGQGNLEVELTGSLDGIGEFATISGYSMGQLVLVVLAIMVITSEYSTGRIRSTLVAVPSRLPVLLAKAAIVALVAFIVSALGIGLSFAINSAIFAGTDMGQLTSGGAVRAFLGVPLYLAALSVFALGLGAIIRSTPGAIGAAMAIILVLPSVGMLVNNKVVQTIASYLPTSVGERLFMEPMVSDIYGPQLGPWQGFAVLCAWALLTVAIGAVLLRTRDA